MRGILLRGWGITYMPVWRGFVVTIAWIVGTYIIFNYLVNRDQVRGDGQLRLSHTSKIPLKFSRATVEKKLLTKQILVAKGYW